MAYLLPGGAVFQDPLDGSSYLLPGGSVWKSPQPQTLQPPLVVNAQTFYAATITVGAVTIQPPLLVNGQIFYGPVVSVGAVPTIAVYAAADGGAIRGARPAQESARTRAAQRSVAARSAQKSNALRVN